MTTFSDTYASSSEAVKVLGIHPMTIQKLFRDGTLPGEKVANRWVIRRVDLDEFAKGYVPKVGRPRRKRKYTKRSQV